MAWLPRAASAGLTSVYDATASAPTEEDAYQILKALDEEGALSLRVFGSVFQSDAPGVIADRFRDYQARFSLTARA